MPLIFESNLMSFKFRLVRFLDVNEAHQFDTLDHEIQCQCSRNDDPQTFFECTRLRHTLMKILNANKVSSENMFLTIVLARRGLAGINR